MYGICNVVVSPIRSEASDKSEMVSQLLFGESFEIIQTDKKWSFIRCTHDDYEGWIDNKQFEHSETENKDFQLCFNISHACDFNASHIPIVLGSKLPKFDGLKLFINEDKYLFNGSTIEANKANVQFLKKIVMKYLNAPYLWGGRSPFGIDCSGFTQVVYSFFDIALPRDAYMQAENGTTLSFISEAKEGDLAFFGDEEHITHVGIVLENNEIIHASGKVRIDTIDHVGIYNKDEKKYTHFLKTIKSIL